MVFKKEYGLLSFSFSFFSFEQTKEKEYGAYIRVLMHTCKHTYRNLKHEECIKIRRCYFIFFWLINVVYASLQIGANQLNSEKISVPN
jgi:hypothetical protein